MGIGAVAKHARVAPEIGKLGQRSLQLRESGFHQPSSVLVLEDRCQGVMNLLQSVSPWHGEFFCSDDKADGCYYMAESFRLLLEAIGKIFLVAVDY